MSSTVFITVFYFIFAFISLLSNGSYPWLLNLYPCMTMVILIFFCVPIFPWKLMWLFQGFKRGDYCIQPTFLCVLPIQPKLQLKSSHNGAICCAVKFSIFSQWIQGWFVWISLINCSHLNYWCSRVKPAFPVTDCLCSQVILPLCYSSLSSFFPSISNA